MTKLRNMIAFWFVVIGALVTVGGAFFQEVEKRREKEKALEDEILRNKVYEEIINNQKTTLDTARSIIHLQEKLEEANAKLIVANEAIRSSQEETLNRVIGGDSKPILLL